MSIHQDSTLPEVAFEVCTALSGAEVTAVLTGGSAATVYAPEAVQSFDLDFIVTFRPKTGSAGQVLESLGFRREGQDYRHAASPFQLEFPPGPLAVGDELIEVWDTLREGERLLHILTPTDSCRDRLASFYHFQDRSALEQARAVAVATGKKVDLKAIRAWSEREGHSGKCGEFLGLLGELD